MVKPSSGEGPPKEFRLPRATVREPQRWYGLSTAVEVHGLSIPGLVWVADTPMPGTGPIHPATIAVWLPAQTDARSEAVEMKAGAWPTPSYGSLTEAQRGLYLRWLASGRAFNIPPRLALLFLHGLEARVVAVGPQAMPAQDREAIVQAARDVGQRFGETLPKVREVGLNLAGFLEAACAPAGLYLNPVPPLGESFETPALVRVALGQAATDGSPVPAAWALAAVLCDMRFAKKTPVTRCREETKELFGLHFDSAFPDGLTLPQAARPVLSVMYSALPNPTTGTTESVSFEVASARQAGIAEADVITLRDIVEECAEELSAYSRFLGRAPAARGEPDAEVRLPPRLLLSRLADKLQALRQGRSGVVEVSAQEAWNLLWGQPAERKDSTPFLLALLDAGGFRVRPESSQRLLVTKRPSTHGSGLRLDAARLDQIRRDDAAASKLLASLFAEHHERPPESNPPVLGGPGRALVPNLDDDQFVFLTRVISRTDWNRGGLQQTASELGLMLDGALEAINDAVLELTGSLLVVEGAELDVDTGIANEVRSMLSAGE